MRIPLDYYRILSLPIQANAEQLRQAHRDRTMQLPRREYSDAAISSRKKLLDEAYAVLSDPAQRQEYDASFLAKTYELSPDPQPPTLETQDRLAATETAIDAQAPNIEIQDEQFVGALLLLQELGEYELVLRLGRPFLTGGTASLKNGQYGDPAIIYSDVVLTVTLACLELGREQWQQGQYENAAEALETGEKLLLREGLFASIRGEIQTDLYKLRPYRVLELLALPAERIEERHKGLQLLREMLEERGGIDGTRDDQSGLTIDDFLRFVQQLRSYLTAAEQQVLFEEEARRPSAVAIYLAVYALLARGFAEHQPSLIRRARVLLSRLSARQDVFLEHAVCALLLGQTEAASRALELSQEREPIAFIREHSQDSPDLLPGLCLYSERWLQDEVFPHFRDLVNCQTSLRSYFADEQVQVYLEAMPEEPELTENWSTATEPTHTSTEISPSADRPYSRHEHWETETVAAGYRGSRNNLAAEATFADPSNPSFTGTYSSGGASAATATIPVSNRGTTDSNPIPPTADRTSQSSQPSRSGRDQARQRGGRSSKEAWSEGAAGQAPFRAASSASEEKPRPPQAAKARRSRLLRLLMPGAVLLSMIALGILVAWLLKNWQSSTTQSAQVEQPLVQLDQPLVVLPSSEPSANSLTLDQQTAQKVIESWLAAKAAAMGPDHQVEGLAKVLAEPKLSEWQNGAEDAKQNNWYKQYKHEVKVISVEPDKAQPDRAEVLAEVSESTDYYEGETLKTSKSDPGLQVRYSLIRTNDQWLIQNWRIGD